MERFGAIGHSFDRLTDDPKIGDRICANGSGVQLNLWF
jgi:hypothetical protein